MENDVCERFGTIYIHTISINCQFSTRDKTEKQTTYSGKTIIVYLKINTVIYIEQ